MNLNREQVTSSIFPSSYFWQSIQSFLSSQLLLCWKDTKILNLSECWVFTKENQRWPSLNSNFYFTFIMTAYSLHSNIFVALLATHLRTSIVYKNLITFRSFFSWNDLNKMFLFSFTYLNLNVIRC